jgi:hypothetical protein
MHALLKCPLRTYRTNGLESFETNSISKFKAKSFRDQIYIMAKLFLKSFLLLWLINLPFDSRRRGALSQTSHSCVEMR